MTCQHTNIRTGADRLYTGSVAEDEGNPMAHGGVTRTVTCGICGAQQERNVNGRHEEHSEWTYPAREAHAANAATDAVIWRLRKHMPAVLRYHGVCVIGADAERVHVEAGNTRQWHRIADVRRKSTTAITPALRAVWAAIAKVWETVTK